MSFPAEDLFRLILVGTAFAVAFVGFFIAVIIANQRKFIRIQKEKLSEGRRLEEVLRSIPRKLLEVQEQERSRLSRDLHDGINQMLASIKYRMHSLEDQSPPQSATRDSARHLVSDLEKTMEEVKRISHNLRPAILDDLGFDAAIRSLCAEFLERSGIDITCRFESLSGAMPKESELAIFRIIQEALHNIEKHANATTVLLTASRTNSALSVTIEDNGTGFEESGLHNERPGLGLSTMRERALTLGGGVDVRSAPGSGTAVTVTIPLGAKG